MEGLAMKWLLMVILLVATPWTANASGVHIGVDKDCVLETEVEDEVWNHREDNFSVQDETPTSVRSVWLGNTFLEGDFRVVQYKGKTTLVIYEITFVIRVGKGGVLEYIWNKK